MNPHLAAALSRLDDERFFFEAPGQVEALARLHYAWEHRLQLALLRGPGGAGKTTLLRRFQLELRTQPTQTFFINANGTSAEELTLRLAWELGMPVRNGVNGGLWLAMGRRFEELAWNQTPVVVLCDDLQLANAGVAEWLTRLWSLLPTGRLPVTIVAGLDDQGISALAPCLAGRIDLRIDVEPWHLEDVGGFVEHLLHEPASKWFDDEALERLVSLSAGNPRHVRQLVRMSLLACLANEERSVNEATLLSVSEELCGYPWEASFAAEAYHVAYA